jgi:hypothetical protein
MSIPGERRVANTAQKMGLPKLRAAFPSLNAAGIAEIKSALGQIGDNGKGNPMCAFSRPADPEEAESRNA